MEGRIRKRSADSQRHFNYAIAKILTALWKAIAISPDYECGINKRTAYYSESPRYRDPNLTFKQTMAAFDGLIALDMIEVMRNGFFDRETGNDHITKYKAKDRLLELPEGVEGNPSTDIQPDLDAESIIL